MEQQELIPAKDFCKYHSIEYSFISSLEESGLISITSVRNSSFITMEEMHKLEKFIHLHYDLDINIEGIETINYLLEKIENMRQEIVNLKNKMDI